MLPITDQIAQTSPATAFGALLPRVERGGEQLPAAGGPVRPALRRLNGEAAKE